MQVTSPAAAPALDRIATHVDKIAEAGLNIWQNRRLGHFDAAELDAAVTSARAIIVLLAESGRFAPAQRDELNAHASGVNSAYLELRDTSSPGGVLQDLHIAAERLRKAADSAA